jgi:hypothetical protein
MLLPHLVTFPRSGSHYFAKLVYEKTMFNIQRSHSINISFDKNNKKTKKIITIARDPKDSITSLIALERSSGVHIPDSKINEMITNYIMFYSFLLQEADYVVDFKELIYSPDSVIDKALGFLQIDNSSYINFPDTTDYDAKGLARESSKSLLAYDNINLNNFNMDLSYFYYEKILSKSKFNNI